MPFTVVWTPDAEERLAQLYHDAPRKLRGAITRASDQIDERLKFTGSQLGAPLPSTPGGWVYAEPVGTDLQLAVVFEFVPDDMLVRVHNPFLIPRPKSEG